MSSLIVFPREILLQIFANVSEEDRFETCQVSRDWFFLTLKTYKAPMKESEENPLLESMAAFYNQATGTTTYSTWYQLYRYIKPEKAYRVCSDVPAYIKVFKKCKAHIKKLDTCLKELLDEDLGSFPRLKCVNCCCWEESPGAKLEKLKQYLGSFTTLMRLGPICAVASFGLELCRPSTYALSKVFIIFAIFDDNQERDTIRAIKQCRTVKELTLKFPVINKEWFRIIPTSTIKLSLIHPKIDSSIKHMIPAINDLLFYCCSDWKRVRYFEAVTGFLNVQTYTCHPLKMTEELRAYDVKANDMTAFKLSQNGFKCTSIAIDGLRNQNDLKEKIPATVDRLSLQFQSPLKPFSLQRVCENPRNLKFLSVSQDPSSYDVTELFLDPIGFHGLNSINMLKVSEITSTGLATVLKSCPVLKTLIIQCRQSNPFSTLPSNVISSSLRTLNVVASHIRSDIIVSRFPNLKALYYSPGINEIPEGFIASMKLEFIKIQYLYSKSLCLEANNTDYPYKFMQVKSISETDSPTGSFEKSTICIYVLSRKVQALRKLMNVMGTDDQIAINSYAQGLSVNFIEKEFKVHSNIQQFIHNVEHTQLN